MTNNSIKGFSIFEIIIVCGIIGLLVAVVVPNLSNFRNEYTLSSTVSSVVSLLHEARTNSISSINSSEYGVYFESSRAVLFKGSTFSSSDPSNKEIVFPSSVLIPTSGGISLSGGSSSVVFSRHTGSTTSSGVITIGLVSDSSRFKTITIYKTGLVVQD